VPVFRDQKKNDVTEDATVFGHVGLHHNWPPSAAGLPFISSSNFGDDYSKLVGAESNFPTLNDQLASCEKGPPTSMRGLAALGAINLIDVFSYYLVLAFAIGTIIRIRNYRAVLGVIFTFSDRWPKLLVVAKRHRTVFLRWPTLLPIGLTLALMTGNAVASHFLWSHAKVSFNDLGSHGIAVATIAIAGAVMLFLDGNAVFGFGRFDRVALELDLDRAEHWLQSWHAPAMRFLTLGIVNPRKIVNEQVLEALTNASLVVTGQMWRWSLQIGMRAAVGLALWMTWALALRGPATELE
jgi:hypothetical protein